MDGAAPSTSAISLAQAPSNTGLPFSLARLHTFITLQPITVPDLLTLTTDFGLKDAYVGAMKGVILSINRDANLCDISHQITPQDVMEAAFTLRESVPYYPDGTVHLVVVDPGVGTDRQAVALRYDNQFFVGPDNGVFSLLLEDDTPETAVELTNEDFWRTNSPSMTFHGRDIFAPAAAHLSAGVSLEELGPPIEELKPLRWAMPIDDDEGIQGWIVHIDRFGNCITNIPHEMVDAQNFGQSFRCIVGSKVLRSLHETYGEVATGEPLVLFGSSGFMEIAVNSGNAAELLGIRKGDSVNVLLQMPDEQVDHEG